MPSVLLPLCSSRFICVRMWDHRVRRPQVCRESSPHSCASPPPPTGLDECVFFNSLGVGLPYSSIFCQFWSFLVFKLLLSFFWLCEEAQCVYLCFHLGRKSSSQFFKCCWVEVEQSSCWMLQSESGSTRLWANWNLKAARKQGSCEDTFLSW